MSLTTRDPWKPKLIDIELEFTSFVRGYRDGKTLSEFLPDIPPGLLNADFVLPLDNVIAELKVLRADAADGATYASRLASSYRHFGYTEADLFAHVFRGQEMPRKVAARIFSMSKRIIVQAIEKANKQIRSTRGILGTNDSKGLVLLANDSNFGFSHAQMIGIIANSFANLKVKHIDYIVYFTPNVYHDTGDDIAKQFWTPVYNVGSEDFGDFVNPLGKAWLDYVDQIGDPAIEREAGDDLFEKYADATPIMQFRRQ